MSNQTETTQFNKPFLDSHNPSLEPIIPIYHPSQRDTFSANFIRLTQQRWELNGLYRALSTLIGPEDALAQMLRYNIGTSKWNGGSTIFWQQSDHYEYEYTGGFIAKFDPHSGITIDNQFTTTQNVLDDLYGITSIKPQSINFIGLHLVDKSSAKPIIICQNPITALIGSYCFNQYTWLIAPIRSMEVINPSFKKAPPSSINILLIAEPGHEEESSLMRKALNRLLSDNLDQRVGRLEATELPGFQDSMIRWMLIDRFYADWIFLLATR